MNKKALILAAVVVAVFAIAYMAASPYVAVAQIRDAAESRDSEALSGHIDFPSVREDMKLQLKGAMREKIEQAKEEDDAMAGLAAAFATTFVDNFVDMYVTPDGIKHFMKGKPVRRDGPEGDTTGGGGEKPWRDPALSYEDFGTFNVTVTNKQDEKITFVLERQGIASWKITRIELPPFPTG